MAVKHAESETSRSWGADPAPDAGPPLQAGPVACARWLMGILDQQLSMFASLDALSIEQSAAVIRNDTDGLLGVLARRERVIQTIVELSDRVTPVRATWPDLAALVPEDQRSELRRRMDAIEAAVHQISQRDDADRSALERERGNIAEELATMGRARGAVNAYAAPVSHQGPRFQDRTG